MKSITRIFVVLLAILMLIPVVTTIVGAAKEKEEKQKLEAIVGDTGKNVTNNTQGMTAKQKIDVIYDYIADKIEKENPSKHIKRLNKAAEGLKASRTIAKNIISYIKGEVESEDFDLAVLLDTFISVTTDVLDSLSALPPPAGPILGVISSALDILYGIFKAAMGGESPTPEMVQLEDRLNMRFDEIKDQISVIEDKLDELSNQITEEANRIISEVTSAIDDLEARTNLREFLLSSGKGDFSYNEFKNYLNGAKNKSTAYNLLYQEACAENRTEDAELYFNLLYKSLVEQHDAFIDGVTGDGYGKSIVQYYYDVLSSRPDLVPSGQMAETMAIDFASDIYSTELATINVMLAYCTEKYIKLCVSGDNFYQYGEETDDVLTLDMIDSIDDDCFKNLNLIRTQFAKDMVYILGLTDYYTVKNDGEIYAICKENSDSFGNVLVGQTIYLSDIDPKAYELFGFLDKFSFVSNEVSFVEGTDNVFIVKPGYNKINIDLCYNGEKIGSIAFNAYSKQDKNKDFMGGSGTITDPYLISNTEQFKAIANDLSKHYKLICDLDFENIPFSPLGRKINSNNNIVYEEFTGSFDGNGYKLKNICISGTDYVGLFGKIGYEGVVSNLNIQNVSLTASIKSATKEDNYYYLGVIAGTNEGTIKYCSVDIIENTVGINTLSFSLDNETPNRNIFINVGGIVGSNSSVIAACSINHTNIVVDSKHDFAGDSIYKNLHEAYVGGIAGVNAGSVGYCLIESETKITTTIKSIYNPETTVSPYMTVLTGGVIGKDTCEFLYDNVSQIKSLISEEDIFCEGILDCQSGWGEYYRNHKVEKDKYIPQISDLDIEKISIQNTEDTLDELKASISIKKEKYELNHKYENGDLNYQSGETEFNKNGLKFFLNGEEKEYEIVDIYGFNTCNQSLHSEDTINVILIVKIIEGNESLYLDYTMNIKVNPSEYETNFPETIVVQDKDFDLESLINGKSFVIKKSYEKEDDQGQGYRIYSENIVKIEELDKGKTDFGKRSYKVTYRLEDGYQVDFVVNVFVDCEHKNINEQDWQTKEEPTCTKTGKIYYYCGDCGEIIKTDYIKQLEHEFYLEGYVPPVCYVPENSERESANGFTGTQICKDCGETIKGSPIPKKPHIYEQISETEHACTQGGVAHTEHHHYTVKESVQWINNKWGIVYTYTCFGCNYSYTETDTNTILDENKALPTVMVSDGYALNIGDEVVVYVQLLNNPGINGACFGIRYTEGLELVGLYDGELFDGSLLSYRAEVNNGYNFVWVGGGSDGNEITSVDTVNGSGNLLKLKFKVTADIEAGKERKVSVVYGMGKTPSGKDVNGGFVTSSNENQCFVTQDGIIKIVDRLPGDVNNDGKVDIKDALEIAKFLTVENKDELDERYANVDLSYNKAQPNASNIGANDIIVLLKSIIGGYGVNLKPYSFDITLVTFDAKTPETTIQASMYNEKGEIVNTYSQIVSELERRGYKFLGWSYSMANGEIISADDFITYNNSQGKQTLYAQWEINSVSFDDGGYDNVTGIMETVYYSSNLNAKTPESFTREYDVVFSWKEGNLESSGTIVINVVKWICKDGEGNIVDEITTVEDAIFEVQNGTRGTLTMTAVWENVGKIESSSLPEWNKTGHSISSWYGKKGSIETDVISANGAVEIENIKKIDSLQNVYYLYPRWKANTYKVTFDANGGLFVIGETYDTKKESSLTYGEKYSSILPESPVREGYTFVGWSIEDGVFINDLTMQISENHTVKAAWKGIPCLLVFNLNGGTLNQQAQSVTPGETCPTMPKPTKIGYDFVGWYYDSSCQSSPVKEGEAVGIIKDTQVYAKWSAKTYTIEFNTNAESILTSPTISSTSVQVKYDSNDSLNIIPTTNDYAFAGWSTAPQAGILLTDKDGNVLSGAGGSGYMVDGKWKPSSEKVTVYATWVRTVPNAQLAESTFTVNKIYGEGEVLAQNMNFTVSGIKVKYEGQYYIYGYAYYHGQPSKDGKYMYDPYSITLETDKEVLIGGLMYWKSNHDNYQQCNVAGWDWTDGNSKKVVYSSEDPGRDFMTNQTITIYITECCIATGEKVECDNDGVPEMLKLNDSLKGTLYMSNNSSNANDLVNMGTMYFDVIGLKVKYGNDYYIYGFANHQGNLNKERRNNVCDIYLKDLSSPVLLGGTMFYRGSKDDGNEASTAGFNRNGGVNSTTIRYMTMHADNDYAGNESNILALFGVCFKYEEGKAEGDTVTPEIVSTKFDATVRCEGSDIGRVTFNVIGIKVTKEENGKIKEYIHGNAFYSGTPGSMYFSNVAELMLLQTSKTVYNGGMIHWYGERGNFEQNGTAGYNPATSNGNNIHYMQEDPGNDFSGNAGTEMSITGICISISG